jgi:hypothetical protein
MTRSYAEQQPLSSEQRCAWNPTAAATTYLLVMTRRIQSLIDALHSLEQPDESTIATVFEENASTYLGWP